MSKTVTSYDLGDVVLVKKAGNYDNEILTHQKHVPNFKAHIAVEMAEKWGMVAAVEDGYDGQGRAKMRALTAEEVVMKACQTADMLVDKMTALGWMQPTPDPQVLHGLPGAKED